MINIFLRSLCATFVFAVTSVSANEMLIIPTYKEVGKAAGVVHQFGGGWEFSVGGGAAAFDCNGDRKADIFFAGGANEAALFVNTSELNGSLAFEKKPLGDESFINVVGAYPLDINGDGYLDLALLRVGENLLLEGDGNCQFKVANDKWRFDGGHAWSTSFTAAWEQNEHFPTLVFGNYVDRSIDGGATDRCHDNFFHRPVITQTNRPDYSNPLPLKPGQCALSALFTDWDNSGSLSLRFANDRQYYGENGEEQLWSIPARKTPHLFTRDEGWQKLQIWGMGIAEADINGDGRPEYAITSMADSKLQTLASDNRNLQPKYKDISLKSNTLAHRPYTGNQTLPSTGWHAEFVDLNNDGFQDLFMAKGNVEDMPNFAAYDPDNLLLGQPDGVFVEVGDKAGIALARRGRGAAFADFNLDGQMDFIVVNRREPISLFQGVGGIYGGKTTPLGNWIKIDLANETDNRNLVGAKIMVQADGRESSFVVSVGGGHASGEIGLIHVGIGAAEHAQVSLTLPGERRKTECDVPANSVLKMTFIREDEKCSLETN